MKGNSTFLFGLVALLFLVQSCYIDRAPLETAESEGSGGRRATTTGQSPTTVTGSTEEIDSGESGGGGVSGESAGGGGMGANVGSQAGSGTHNDTGGVGATGASTDQNREDAAATEEAGQEDSSVDKEDGSAVDAAEDIPYEPVDTVGPEAYRDWDYYEVKGAVCRDGSPAGYYFRRGNSNNLMIFLNGGGVCYDDFFCGSNPANVEESISGGTLADVTLDTFTQAINPERQIPQDEGILKKDAKNPVRNWSMVYVPYCTGDVYAGTTLNAPVITSNNQRPQNFMGYANLGLFYRSLVSQDVMKSEKVLLAGVAAGSFGAFLNFERTIKFFSKSEVLLLADSGFPFRDEYLEPCLVKTWRELWGINKILPSDCTECFHEDGSGLAEGLGAYLIGKYGDRVLGGGISTAQDEVMKLFFSVGLNNCNTNSYVIAMNALAGRSFYPSDRYPAGLADFFDNVIGQDIAGSYLFSGTTHQHLFRSRFYQNNGLNMTMAEWVGEIVEGNATHVGSIN
jgi:hypothetical protein